MMSTADDTEPTTQFVVSLTGPNASNIAQVGGKAANLCRLSTGGHAVPAGFVVTASAHRSFVTSNQLDERWNQARHQLFSEDYMQSAIAAKRLRDAVLAGTMPDSVRLEIEHAIERLAGGAEASQLVAVRSSAVVEDGAVASWAGQFDTFLNVTMEDVLPAVVRCWASFFSSRSLSYDATTETSPSVPAFAVIVQAMVPSETAGVAFSVDPIDGNSSHVRIEAVSGLGDSLVSGKASPYQVVADKSQEILLKRVFANDSSEDLLSASQVRLLVREVRAIEGLLRSPVDVEWAYARGNLWILQARPITALGNAREVRSRLASSDLPDIRDYELTFKVAGLDFLFADVLSRGFGYLDPLFYSNGGEFRQYFTNVKMEYAAREGYRWLSQRDGFAKYQSRFQGFHEVAWLQLQRLVSESPTSASCSAFFALLEEYFAYYSRMDFQFTNLTFLYADEDPIVAENLSRLAAFKDVARVWINQASIDDDSLFAQFLSTVADHTAITVESLGAYTAHEIGELLDGQTFDESILVERGEAFLVYRIQDEVRMRWGAEARDFALSVSHREAANTSAQVIGQVANDAGKSEVFGTVRRINVDYGDMDQMDRDIANMRQGEVLVSEFTAPELMAACRKAAAIVTDLGGMLSHAAIVSRELGVPCVVGTRHASRTFKTGDRVFIDLQAGRVDHAQ